jgi:hypothetical protein
MLLTSFIEDANFLEKRRNTFSFFKIFKDLRSSASRKSLSLYLPGSGISSLIPANFLAISAYFSIGVKDLTTSLAPSGDPPPCMQPGTPAPRVSHSVSRAARARASALHPPALMYFWTNFP